MNVICNIGIIFSIVVIYSVVTWGFGALINHNELDDAGNAIGAWTVGAILFMTFVFFIIDKFGLWKV